MLSTMSLASAPSSALASFTAAAMPAMSPTVSSGLVGVSIHTTFVFGRIAARTDSMLPRSATEYSTPQSPNIVSTRRYVPP